jgi:ArsR family transcriptional regulator, arsenate/arsenite/antimonite-responsive transcriptional repressor
VSAKLERHAAQLAALGNPLRLAVLRLVVQGDSAGTAVGALQGKLDVPWSTLSHHLDKLTSAGLLRSRPDGKFIYYSADFDTLRALTRYVWEDCCKGGQRAKAGCC